MTVPPEIKRLRNEAAATVVALSLAEQAVRDAEARVRGRAENVKGARREAFREAVEALREWGHGFDLIRMDPGLAAAGFLERRFITSEGEDDDA